MKHKQIPPVNHDPPGMKGERGRNEHGPLREILIDKRVDTLEEEYDVDFGVRGDMTVGTLREELGVTSMQDLLKHAKKN